MQTTIVPVAALRTPYLVSRTYERLGPCAACDGCEHCEDDPSQAYEDRGHVYEDEPMSLDDLASEAGCMGLFEPSASHAHDGMWWTEADDHCDRAHFEQGEHARDSLHVRRLDGRPMTPGELARVYEAVMGELPRAM